ncbi:MAG: AAA family ATPase [Actinobacteria bacterium]|nr:AAA family ATPase [Actinomycetota bacterium]
MANANAESILAGLDPKQQVAAQSLVGPTCILAGAGTGKTRTVTHRIAYGIATGHFAANRVLALTYTNRAAGELRSRLRSLGVGAVSVRTFHAAALAQLEYFWPQLVGVPAPSILDSKAKLIGIAAKSLSINLDNAALRDMASEIEWRKYSMLSMDEYAQLADSRPKVAGLSFQKNLEIQKLYEQEKIRAQKLDWEDVLVLTLGLLKAEPRALAHVQSQYRFFTVDEYQDISPLQHALLDQWLGEHAELCVVGDPNQTIYSFTGASSEFLRNFADRFPGASVVDLTTNYRSTKQIVAFANRLTSDAALGGELEAAGPAGLAPQVASFESSAAEAKAVATAISEAIAGGVSKSDIAVLYRINNQSELLERALDALGISYQLRGGERFFARAEIKSAVQLIRAEALSPSGKPLHQAVSDIVRSLGWQANKPTEVGVVASKWEALNALLLMLDDLPEGAGIKDFALELADRAHSQHEPTTEAVTLSTIHAAKGLEWPMVFIVGLNEGYLPITYAKTDAAIQEEKRLLYVGITRAMRDLRLSFATFDASRERSPSRFIAVLQPGLAK